MNSQFVLGLIAGEGSFSAYAGPSESRRFGVQVEIDFSVKMKEEDVLQSARDFVGLGYISYTGDYTMWTVSSNDDVQNLIEWIEEQDLSPFKQTLKHDSYQNWKEVVQKREDLMKSKEGMKELVQMARSINYFDKKLKYSTEELFEIIEQNEVNRCGYDGCRQTVSSADETCYAHPN